MTADRALTAAERTQWDASGWLVRRAALTDREVTELRGWIEGIAAWAGDGTGRGLHHLELTDSGPALARSEHFADLHAPMGRFLRHGLITELLAELFGEPAVLFKEKINYKHPGGGGFAPHQDAAAYRFADHHISVALPIDHATIESGCLWFAPGHRSGPLPTDARGRLDPDVAERADWRPVELEPGDLVAFDSYAPHRSDTNRTTHPRRTLYVTYNATSAGDHRATYYADKLAEFEREGASFGGERVRLSLSDDFLGRPVPS